jgi:hypothetical protein
MYPPPDDDAFYWFLKKQKKAHRYIPIWVHPLLSCFIFRSPGRVPYRTPPAWIKFFKTEGLNFWAQRFERGPRGTDREEKEQDSGSGARRPALWAAPTRLGQKLFKTKKSPKQNEEEQEEEEEEQLFKAITVNGVYSERGCATWRRR